jgi:hypothetical protein
MEEINMKTISRRDFLKGAALSAASLAATSLLGGCSSDASDSTVAETIGTAAAGEPAETVSVASGVEDATVSDWLGTAPVIDESQVVTTYEADVIVVGAGNAGNFAAAAAVEEGAETILIEKFFEEFGGSGIRDTLGAIGSKQQIANHDNPDKFDVITELYRVSNGYGDQRLYKVWADHSGEMIDWFTDRLAEGGWEFLHEIDEEHADNRYPAYDTGHTLQLGMNDYDPNNSARVIKNYATDLGLQIHYETDLLSLIKEDGKVTGLYANNPEGLVKYVARKGVIMCTGGYSLNTEMLAALQPETLLYDNNNSSFPGSTGYGIKAMLWAGAQMDSVHASCVFDRGAIKPDALGNENGYQFWMGSQPFLKVDLNGNRFTNESGFYDHILHDSTNLPYHTYAMVWDANYVSDIQKFDTHGCSRMFPHSNGTEAVMPIEYIDGLVLPQAREDGYIVTADTLEELAEKLGLPVENFVATCNRYNELYDMQEDEDFGKEAYRLSEMRTAPFEGVRMSGGYFINTMDGVKINTDMNVVDEEGHAIEGLYAAGDCSGGYFATSYPNLLAGAAAGRSATFGRLAGKNAAHRV